MTQIPTTETRTEAQQKLSAARRLVVKVGSSLLVDSQTGDVRRDWLTSLVTDLSGLKGRGCDIILVSSGAIALGRQTLGQSVRPTSLDELQAAAAVGQIHLAEAYGSVFADHSLTVGQVLLSLSDFEDRRRYLNARATVDALLTAGVIPIFNENDTVATQEIRFGDNDRLAARVAGLVQADVLILLSDVDGLYTADPATSPDAQHIPVVPQVTDAVRALAGPAGVSGYGTGGMVSKLAAADLAASAGTAMLIADGRSAHPIDELGKGARATLFETPETPLDVRKRWLRGLSAPKGTLTLDEGAVEALRRGSSLLAVGVTDVEGHFGRGDAVDLFGPNKERIGIGLAGMTAEIAAQIIGLSSGDAAKKLGHAPRSSLVHRDDLVIL